MRLDRYVSQATGTPRKQVARWIRAGRVRVGERVVRDGGWQVVVGHDDVAFDQQLLRPPGHRLLIMHKPAGCISALRSETHTTVLDHVPEALRHSKLAPIGRLDRDTTGLLLLTTDGGLSQLICHPRRFIEKAYVATLKEPLPAEAVSAFERGVTLADGHACRPARVEALADDDSGQPRVRVTVREGKYHQVKRMLGVFDGFVVALHRERVGVLHLPPDLPEGACRPLTADELVVLTASLPATRVQPRYLLDDGRLSPEFIAKRGWDPRVAFGPADPPAPLPETDAAARLRAAAALEAWHAVQAAAAAESARSADTPA